MKIFMRHGKCTPCTTLVNGNVSHLILPEEIISLVEKGELIRSKFSTLPMIYAAHTDRAIETALLISPDGEELLQTARKKIEEKMVLDTISKKSAQWYQRFNITLPSHITIEKALYDMVPENIMSLNNVVVIIHSDAMDRLGLKLGPGDFVEFP